MKVGTKVTYRVFRSYLKIKKIEQDKALVEPDTLDPLEEFLKKPFWAKLDTLNTYKRAQRKRKVI